MSNPKPNNNTPFWRKSFYCGDTDYSCGKCRVCKYITFRNDAESIGLPSGSSIETDKVVEIFVEKILPKEQS